MVPLPGSAMPVSYTHLHRAGCGIHNCGGGNAQHDGIHTFYLAKNAKLRYVEKHYGEGDGRGKQVMNPTTIVHLAEGAQMEMETTQIAGIDDTMRKTSGDLAEGASLVIHEKIMTTGDQHAVTDFDVDLNGEGCSANVVSRSVAKDVSKQEFISHINGNCACAGHSECDAIIMDLSLIHIFGAFADELHRGGSVGSVILHAGATLGGLQSGDGLQQFLLTVTGDTGNAQDFAAVHLSLIHI